MKILFLDSATEACSCALSVDDDTLGAFEYAPRGHARLLLPMAERLLAEVGIGYADLDLVACGRGPGSFTGVRIGMGCAMGIASSLELPMLGVSSLETLAAAAAAQAETGETIHAAIDARMGEVYYAGYEKLPDGGLRIVTHECVVAPHVLTLRGDLGVGTGFAAYPELHACGAWRHVDGAALPLADHGVRLAREASRDAWVSARDIEPAYLRNDVAKPPKKTAL